MIDEKLRELSAMLATHVPTAWTRNLLEYVQVGEAEVGLEELCDVLFDEQEPLTAAEVGLIREVGGVLGVTRASFLRIDELCVED